MYLFDDTIKNKSNHHSSNCQSTNILFNSKTTNSHLALLNEFKNNLKIFLINFTWLFCLCLYEKNLSKKRIFIIQNKNRLDFPCFNILYYICCFTFDLSNLPFKKKKQTISHCYLYSFSYCIHTLFFLNGKILSF